MPSVLASLGPSRYVRSRLANIVRQGATALPSTRLANDPSATAACPATDLAGSDFTPAAGISAEHDRLFSDVQVCADAKAARLFP
jgi:hypothetical protein